MSLRALSLSMLLLFASHAQAVGRGCDAVVAEIGAKLQAKGVTRYRLDVVSKRAADGRKVVGDCADGNRLIVYRRGGPVAAPVDAPVATTQAGPRAEPQAAKKKSTQKSVSRSASSAKPKAAPQKKSAKPAEPAAPAPGKAPPPLGNY